MEVRDTKKSFELRKWNFRYTKYFKVVLYLIPGTLNVKAVSLQAFFCLFLRNCSRVNEQSKTIHARSGEVKAGNLSRRLIVETPKARAKKK